MSGLDPLGRRDVRDLILGLRDRGCTVFFSSHILSRCRSAVQPRRDRRAGPAGRGAAGSPSMLAFELKAGSWSLPDVRDARSRALGGRGRAHDAARRRPVHAGAAARCGPGAAHRASCAPTARAGVAEPDPRHARRLLRAAGRDAQPSARRGDGRSCGSDLARSPSPSSANRSATRCSTAIVVFAVLLIGGVVPDRPADRRPGREDHQGSRPGRDRRCSGCSSRSSSASAWSRRKSSSAASTAC